MAKDTVFHQALLTILREIFDGPPGAYAFLLNPGDSGLLRELETVDAAIASSRAMPGQTTVAQHVAHVLYGIELLNRWAEGEENPWASADWKAAWKLGAVDQTAWKDLVGRLRSASAKWQSAVAAKVDGWDDTAAAGALASAAHTAYHLGAIRQILAAANAHQPA